MRKRKKGGDKMTTMTLSQIESRVKNNNQKYKTAISNFQEKTRNSDLRKGRVRPKHPTEAKLLSMFSRK
ncbi:hypothetical protein [Alkalihalophilus marmarensis]|uniref:hypothetical protein n=1 Tax=Alkalihalophilus marmarensis TaxID=521377 RepID=UPI002E24DC7A|nr:hypothetical protein [Alkalihalophilus marmarensis]